MEPSRELIDDIYRERVERARRTPPGERLLEAARLFDLACKFTLAGIRHQHPGASEEEIQGLLDERVALARRLESAQ